MFCSQCGKKVMDSMIFCPFCGSPIVIPGQEVDASSEPSQWKEDSVEIQLNLPKDSPSNETKGFEPLNLDVDWSCEESRPLLDPDEESEEFEPLDLDVAEEDETVVPEAARDEDISGEISELLSRQLRDEPVKLQGRVPNLSSVRTPEAEKKDNRRKADTYAPVRAFNPEDMFMDAEDDYDDEDEDEEYVYEDEESGGFFIRHIRGVVAMALFLVVMAIVVGWTLSSAGQTTLAQANLAWRPQIYEKLGYEAYQNSQFALSAEYYARALERDSDSFSDAYSAGVAYYRDGNVEKAAEMGKRAVEIAPSRADGYLLLQRLYPDASNRPWEIQQLLQQGYQLTGEEALNDVA